MLAAGVKGDNSHFTVRLTSSNPTDVVGFSFGTAIPYFFWSDHTQGNRKIPFVEIPISGYELGYHGSSTDYPQVDKALYLANYYQMPFNFFYHPVYIAQYPACRAAIDHMLSSVDAQGLNILHSTPDNLTRWWLDRSSIAISSIQFLNNRLSFHASKPSAGSYVVKIPLGGFEPVQVPYPYEIKTMFGNRWLMIVLPEGESDVSLDLMPLTNANRAGVRQRTVGK
jgi:hypothetical protein